MDVNDRPNARCLSQFLVISLDGSRELSEYPRLAVLLMTSWCPSEGPRTLVSNSPTDLALTPASDLEDSATIDRLVGDGNISD